MPVSILIADDKPLALEHVKHVLQESHCAGWHLLSNVVAIRSDCDLQDWLKSALDVTGDVGLILDLGFRGDAETSPWNTVTKILDSTEYDSLKEKLPNNQWDGVAVALQAIKLPNIARLLIFVASYRDTLLDAEPISETLIAEIRRQQKEHTHKVILRQAPAVLASSAPGAKKVLNMLAKLWAEHFPNSFHSHSATNDMLAMFISPWTENYTCPERKFSWCHECLDSTTTTFRKKLSASVPGQLDAQSAKCLLMLEADVAASSPDWKAVWTAFDCGACERFIQPTVLKGLLRALDVSSAGIEDADKWAMPIMPALPFLVSLSHLIRKFQEDNGPKPTVNWQCKSGRYKISFSLAKKRMKGGVEQQLEPRGLEQAYTKMLKSNRRHGVCEAIENILFCRLGGLNEIMPMLGLFNGKGLDKQVVDLDFGDHSFQLSWPKCGKTVL